MSSYTIFQCDECGAQARDNWPDDWEETVDDRDLCGPCFRKYVNDTPSEARDEQ